VPSQVGAALGAPDDICVSLSGDGGFMMNGNEVSTAAQYGIGAVWVVHYNDTLTAVEVNLQQEFPGDGWMDLYKLGAPNLVDFARGLGADAVEVGEQTNGTRPSWISVQRLCPRSSHCSGRKSARL
jgi:acetolactate synthase-1/2/3 large subunit